jgi:hypothetical protein
VVAEGPLPELCERTCVVCPAQVIAPGQFDVVDRPGPELPYDPQRGYRVDSRTGTATCVHPYRVGLPPGRYASVGEPMPAAEVPTPRPSPGALELPEELVDLEGWLVAVLRAAPTSQWEAALVMAETKASQRFPARDVVEAMRRVLAYELAGRT